MLGGTGEGGRLSVITERRDVSEGIDGGDPASPIDRPACPVCRRPTLTRSVHPIGDETVTWDLCMDADCGHRSERWRVPRGGVYEVVSGGEMSARIDSVFRAAELAEQTMDPDDVTGDAETIGNRWRERGEPWASEYAEQVEMLEGLGRLGDQAAREAEANVRRLISIQATGDLVGVRRR